MKVLMVWRRTFEKLFRYSSMTPGGLTQRPETISSGYALRIYVRLIANFPMGATMLSAGRKNSFSIHSGSGQNPGPGRFCASVRLALCGLERLVLSSFTIRLFSRMLA